MQPNEYQEATERTELYSNAAGEFISYTSYDQAKNWLKLAYCTGKLNGEAGEAAEIVFKAFRGNLGQLDDEQRKALIKELGDVLWYVARIAALIDIDLETVMQINIDKLQDRKDRGVVHGYGDDR